MYREGVMAEIIVVFLLVMNQIWNWPQYPWLITLPLGIVIASWILRKDSFRTLGLNPEPMPKDLLEFLICFFIFSFLVILAADLIYHPDWFVKWSQAGFWLKFLKRAAGYYPWALFQQLCVCGYFGNRFYCLFNDKNKTALATALLFAIAHFPNPVLLVAGFIGGYFSIYFFLQARNLYWLALGHALFGPAILMFLEYTLRIGPNFWK